MSNQPAVRIPTIATLASRSICTPKCWTPETCAVCGLTVAPLGRSIPAAAAGSFCSCTNVLRDVLWGAHLWNEHDEDRIVTDPTGWAKHVAQCEQCGGETDDTAGVRREV